MFDHEMLDARHSEARPRTFEETVVDDFNNKDLVWWSEILSDLHSAFRASMKLSCEDVPSDVTPEIVKEKLGGSQAALHVIIPKCEQSGTGFGAQQESDKDFGRLTVGVMEGKGDKRGDCLNGCAPHVLCHWHKMDQQDVSGRVLSKLTKALRVTSDGKSPKVANVPLKKKSKKIGGKRQGKGGGRLSGICWRFHEQPSV